MSDLSLAIVISAVDKFSSALGPIGSALAGLATTVAGVGAHAVQMAGDFQESLTSLATGAGESQSNLKMVSDGILDLSTKTATSTKQLTDGMYLIESAGYHGAQGLQVLQAAAEGAKVGNADLGTVANAVTTVLNDYHMSSDQATAATNALVTTVADGKTHLQDLSGAMGSVLPLASSLGISFGQVGGAIATMTNAGMDAQRASMNLANAIRALSAPNAIAAGAMKEVGLSAQQLKDTLSSQGLTGAIQLIEDHVGKTFPANSVQAVEAFKAIMGGATGYNVALMLGGKNMETFENDVKSITGAMNAGGDAVKGWDLVQEDFNFKLQQAQQSLNVLMIRLGNAFLPVLTQLLGVINPLIASFGDWIQKSGVVNGIITFIQKTVESMLPDLKVLWGQLVAIVTQVADWAMKNDVLGKVMHDVMMAAEIFFMIIRNSLPIIERLVLSVLNVIDSLENWILKSGVIQQITPILSGIVQILTGALQILTQVILPVITGFVNWILQTGIIQGALKLAGQGVQAFGGFLQGSIPTLKSWGDQAKSAADAVLGLGNNSNNVKQLGGPGRQGSQGPGGGGGESAGAEKAVGGIMGALQGLASFVQSVFAPIWQNIVSIWNTQVVPAWQNFLKVMAPLVPTLRAVGAVVVGVVVLIVTEFLRLVSSVPQMFVGLEAALAQIWLGIIELVGGAVAWIADLVGQNFAGMKNDVTAMMTGIHNIITGIWNGIMSFIKPGLEALKSIFDNVSNDAFKIFEWLYNTLIGHSIIPDLVNGIVSWFTNLGPRVLAVVTNFVNGLADKFKNLAASAVNWGKNLIQGFIDGINSMINNVRNAASNIAGQVNNFLGFHSPAKEGPGADLMNWGPGLIQGFSEGMLSALPTLNAAVNVTAQHLTPIATANSGASSAGGGGVVINISIDGRSQRTDKDLVDLMTKELSKKLRQQGIAPRYTSGGTHS